MLGDLLIAPIVNEGEKQRDIYLPEGKWENIFTGDTLDGKISVNQKCQMDEISVFIKYGSGMMFNLNSEFELGATVGNDVDTFINPSIYISGNCGEYTYLGVNVDVSIN